MSERLEIAWEPTSNNSARLDVEDPSEFMDMMKYIGFTLPCTLDDTDLPVMRAAAALYIRRAPPSAPTRDVDTQNPFKEIVNLIIAHNSIDIFPVT